MGGRRLAPLALSPEGWCLRLTREKSSGLAEARAWGPAARASATGRGGALGGAHLERRSRVEASALHLGSVLGVDLAVCWAYWKGAGEDGEDGGAAVLQGAGLEELVSTWWAWAFGRRCSWPTRAQQKEKLNGRVEKTVGLPAV
ncbi:hypothetical protein NDU88_006975 [Pleurodeles waltl]|uniref:Uncharacterized protein n=1 Tax=Pleurodeles waltl TaxID=8319 RepID=A0AAV7QJD9_PLEWA|nr:hypothetical protein NDU88_006975 [Pleurodeles waltl]